MVGYKFKFIVIGLVLLFIGLGAGALILGPLIIVPETVTEFTTLHHTTYLTKTSIITNYLTKIITEMKTSYITESRTITNTVTVTETKTVELLTATQTATKEAATFILFVSTKEGIYRITSEGEKDLIINLPPDFNFPAEFTLSGERLYVMMSARSTDIEVYSLEGEFMHNISLSQLPAGYQVVGLVVLPNENIALLDNYNDLVYIINQQGTLLKTVKIKDNPDNHLQNCHGIVVNNTLIISEDGNKHVIGIDLDTFERKIIFDLAYLHHWLGSIAYSDGKIYLSGPRQVYRLDYKNLDQHAVKITELPEYNIAGLSLLGNFAYLSVNFGGKIYKINLETGDYSIFVSNLNFPEHLELYVERS